MAYELPARYGKVRKQRRTKGNVDGHCAYRHGSQRGAPIGGVKEAGRDGGRSAWGGGIGQGGVNCSAGAAAHCGANGRKGTPNGKR